MQMGEKPIIKKGKFDPIVEETLREKPRSRKELLALNKQAKCALSKVPYKTLDRRLKQLEKYGIIEHIPDVYRLVEPVEEADRDEVEDHLKVICNRDENEEIIYGRIKRLRVLSSKKRLASIPGVLATLDEALDNPNVADTKRNFEELTLTLTNILNHERKYKMRASEQIIKEMSENILKKVIRIVKQNSEFPEGNTIDFMAESENREVVETLFILITKFKDDLDRSQIEKIGRALKKLHKYHQIINKHIDDLIRNGNEKLQPIGKQLREIYLWQASL